MRITSQLKLNMLGALIILLAITSVVIWSLSQFKFAKEEYAQADSIRNFFIEDSALRDSYLVYRESRILNEWNKNNKLFDQILSESKKKFKGSEFNKTIDILKKNDVTTN